VAIHQQMHLPAVLRVAIIVVMAVCIVEAICSGVLHVHLPPSLKWDGDICETSSRLCRCLQSGWPERRPGMPAVAVVVVVVNYSRDWVITGPPRGSIRW
jgi:hypothetical protein